MADCSHRTYHFGYAAKKRAEEELKGFGAGVPDVGGLGEGSSQGAQPKSTGLSTTGNKPPQIHFCSLQLRSG